jgi:hypothetical protein
MNIMYSGNSRNYTLDLDKPGGFQIIFLKFPELKNKIYYERSSN